MNNGGLTNIFMGTSSASNYGISLNALRFTTSSTPKFVIKTHNNSSGGVDRLTIDDNGDTTISGQLTAGPAYIGIYSGSGLFAQFSHNAFKNDQTKFSLLQRDNGETIINSGLG